MHALYYSPNIIRNLKLKQLRWAEHVAHMKQSRNVYGIYAGRPEGKRSLGRLRRRWEDNIKMDLKEVVCDTVNRMDLTQDRDHWWACIKAIMNLRIPKNQLVSCPSIHRLGT